MNATAIAAVNNGVAAFSRAVNPAGSVSVAIEIRVKGTAENSAPTMTKLVKRPRATRSVAGPATTSRIPAPIARRTSAAHTGPTSGAATRRKRKAAPQTAPRNRSEARSASARGRRAAGPVVTIGRWSRRDRRPRHRPRSRCDIVIRRGVGHLVAMDYPGGRFAMIADPQGGIFGILKTS